MNRNSETRRVLGVNIAIFAVLGAVLGISEKEQAESFYPRAVFADTKITNPDLNSLQNMQWDDRLRELKVTHPGKPAEFGYKFKAKYWRIKFKTSTSFFDDNSTRILKLERDGTINGTLPYDPPSEFPPPSRPRFLR